MAKTFVPVLEGAMERALLLASAMDSRGYGRRIHQTESKRKITNILMLLGLLGILFGLAGLLGVFSRSNIGTLTMLIGISLSSFALINTGDNLEIEAKTIKAIAIDIPPT